MKYLWGGRYWRLQRQTQGTGNDNGGISGRAKGLVAREDRFIQVGQEAWLSRWDCVGTRPWGALEDESSIMETTFGGKMRGSLAKSKKSVDSVKLLGLQLSQRET